MRIIDLGQTSSHNFTPMAVLSGDRRQSERIASAFNQQYGSRDRLSATRRPSALRDMMEENRREELRMIDILEANDHYDELRDSHNAIRPMRTVEDFRNIPENLHLPILWFKPVREAVAAGRMEGFDGLDASILPEEDPYERILSNGQADIEEDGTINHRWVFETTDPDLSRRDVRLLREMRAMIVDELIPLGIDPTNSHREIG